MGRYNCDIYADIDFGNGPVTIRCTEIGKHDNHRCEVFIEIPVKEHPIIEQKVNIFDEQNS